MKFFSYPVPFYLLLSTSSAFAGDGVGNWREYVYLIELAVIGLVSFALIVLTVTISAQKKRSSKLFVDFREEVKQEKAIINATIDDMKNKERQIAYVANMLQKHMDESAENQQSKKKSQSVLLTDATEIDSEIQELPALELKEDGDASDVTPLIRKEYKDETSADVSFIHDAFDTLTDDDLDPRTISADGSVKTEHLGAHGYMEAIKQHEESAIKTSTHLSNALTGVLTRIIEQTDESLNTTSKHKANLEQFVAILQADNQRAANNNNKEEPRSAGLISTMNDLEGRVCLLHDYQKDLHSIYLNTLKQLSEYEAPDFDQKPHEVVVAQEFSDELCDRDTSEKIPLTAY